ncbi:DNA-directed RNA polymerase subunit 2 RPB2 [Orpheovirus IHUMI-LCC2]|uniref:DNA-directed RNA polymerase n=1 Tax=Orpheovirus IHUMI-LCC2 TaxID=2023057 RepID=A0A2I2L5R6_9VIRU|nr:DNA-directed RNA polymerase subunit 2 RPB2 [Orpheovirus IHUMI-LCC2]SNW62840.1 DNA-directed RNA polymerase subunit 2 RPB2 [Orpheovirus IHUMI-LCC2]
MTDVVYANGPQETNRSILAPPLSDVLQVENKRSDDAPGSLKLDEHGKLLFKYVQYEKPTSFLLSPFDEMVNYTIPNILSSKPIKTQNGYAVFSEIRYERPKYSGNGTQLDLYPAKAKNDGKDYTAAIRGYIKYFNNANELVAEHKDIQLFSIPVMVGSVLCRTYPLRTPEELISVGQDPEDYGGYFITDGNERIVINQEKLRMNIPLIYLRPKDKDKGRDEEMMICRMTINGPKNSEIIIINIDEKKTILTLELGFLGKDDSGKKFSISPFLPFALYGITDPNIIMNLVLQKIKPENRERVKLVLQRTVAAYQNITNHVDYLANRMEAGSLTTNDKMRLTAKTISEQFMSHIPSSRPQNRLHMLAYMIAISAEYLSGLRKPDDRNSWSIKQAEVAAKLMGDLIRKLYGRITDDIESTVSSDPNAGLPTIIREIGKLENITSDLITSIGKDNKWGYKTSQNSYYREGVTVTMPRGSALDAIGFQMRVSAATNKKSKQPKVRAVQQSQYGYICPGDTPEGEPCGIVKVKALTSYFAHDRPNSSIVNIANAHVSVDPSLEKPNLFIINAEPFGWCNSTDLRRILVEARRQLLLDFDICIVVDASGALIVSSDAGRPVRPLLVVGSDGILEIDKKKMWDASFEDLLKNGCVEYLDAWEQEMHSYIAIGLERVRSRPNEEQEIKRSLGYINTELEAVTMAIERLDEIANNINARPGNMWTQEETDELKEMRDYFKIVDYQDLISLRKDWQYKYETAIRALNKYQNKKYTHCELDPTALYGISISLIPGPQYIQGPRLTYQSSMGKQALGLYASNFLMRYDDVKMLANPTNPMVATNTYHIMGFYKRPAGRMMKVAYLPIRGYTQDDSLIFNKASLDLGSMMIVKYLNYSASEGTAKDGTKEVIGVIDSKRNDDKYKYVKDNGLPSIGQYLKEGDVVIARYRRRANPNDPNAGDILEDASVKLEYWDSGVVENVLISEGANRHKSVTVKLRSTRIPRPSDKFAARYAQKATVGAILPKEDIPFIPGFGVPDILVNSLSIPSRMTITQLYEMLLSQVGGIEGGIFNLSGFRNFDYDDLERYLRAHGLASSGKYTFIRGDNGKTIVGPVMYGYIYYQALKHHVKDKMQYRATGQMDPVTRQPVKGRKRRGGLRVGEMERDAVLSHGATGTSQAFLCKDSDGYVTAYCVNCGTLASSRLVDVKREYHCRRCGEKGKFGRVLVPYIFIYLSHTMGGMGYETRLDLKRVKMVRSTLSEQEISQL